MKSPITPSKREYNRWVANETLEDYALRFTAKKARRWSGVRIANTALGVVSFLALEAIGGAITLQYGFTNSMWAIFVVLALIFIFGLPICYHAAKSGLDIDLLTRAAGFGYIGSTISSLIYASFTFIFFALEAAIMSVALQLLFGIPISWAYVISALIVIPLVTHGISRISSFQLWTQPIWLILQFTPLIFILTQHSEVLAQWTEYKGLSGQQDDTFNLALFGAASAVIFPLMAQNGEQVDFLRFLPQQQNSKKWWIALILSGPGWTIFGVLKLFVGSFLAVLALQHGLSIDLADDPTHMYLIAYSYVTNSAEIALILVAVFVIISQLKINVTNAYAGSLAWSNFFSRLTHCHPGRVVWLFFNVAIALLLMELGLYQAFETILITYSSLVLAWIGTLVADLVINRALKLRPKALYFQRSQLFDINPVGLGSMIIASGIAIFGQLGVFGETVKALASYIALFLPFVTAPLIAWWTQGKYYQTQNLTRPTNKELTCTVCDNTYESEDMSHCPAYKGHICSLCCALDTSCNDQCRPKANLNEQLLATLQYFLPQFWVTKIHSTTGRFFSLLLLTTSIIASLFALVFYSTDMYSSEFNELVSDVFYKLFFLLMIVTGVLTWLYVLAQSSKQKAFEQSQHRTIQLSDEMEAHHKTLQELKSAKQTAIDANQAKSRYLSGVSHELRTPLNTILGYAQLLESDKSLSKKHARAATAIRRGSDHLTDVIEGLLEISKIEARRLDFHNDAVHLKSLIEQIVEMFSSQAESKGIAFHYICNNVIPEYVNTDEKRLRQILINLISNAIKYTPKGSVTFVFNYRNQVAKFEIIDTGVGISHEQQKLIYEPFNRIHNNQTSNIQGTGLGLTISRLLINLLGGDLQLTSEPNKGSQFTFSIMLPPLQVEQQVRESLQNITGYEGDIKSILVVDDEPDHRQLLEDYLQPLGFNIYQANNAKEALKIINKKLPDLILMDVQMPTTSGWELAQTLRNDKVLTPIIMVSGNALESNPEFIDKKLHDDFLAKPIQLKTLLEKIAFNLNLEWSFENTDQPINKQKNELKINDTLPAKADLEELISMAKIGYLNGVSDKIETLSQSNIDTRVIDNIQAKVDNCDFESIIKLTQELIDGYE